MRKSDLRKLIAENPNFERAELTDAVMSASQIRGCNFTEAWMDGVSLDFGSDLEFCNFERARAMAASFHSANFRRAKMSGAKFRGSTFRDADLYLADLSFADLRDSDLRGADLGTSDLFGAQLSGAFFNFFTRLPFDRGEATRLGMIFTP
ncbi:MAG: pentapeptide repeat-containing protein [Bdellovibrionales bacterium]|nr:pentapeptide repeat-containing protein [Bdellovibrionales bacterium]